MRNIHIWIYVFIIATQISLSQINFIQNKAFELSLFLSLPASMALVVASEEITSDLFGDGAFAILRVSNSILVQSTNEKTSNTKLYINYNYLFVILLFLFLEKYFLLFLY